MRKVMAFLTVAACLALPLVGAGWAAADDYVLTAGQWGSAQTAAVAAAGGTVKWAHGEAGVGVAVSSNAAFLSKVLAGGAFQYAGKDTITRWQPPVRTAGLEQAAVTPGDETFINMQWNIPAIDAPGAWAAGYTGAGARVAVLDGGIYKTHIDLAGQIDEAASRSFVPGKVWNTDTGTFWHGTHVAGIVAAKDNGIGTIGVAPGATIIGVKVLDNGSGAFSWVIQGILYAATPMDQGGAGADIINMSLGATFARGGGPGGGPLIAALNKAVNYAARNTLVVVAAGNDGLDIDHSGSVITVPAQSGSGIAISATGPVGYAVGWPIGATNFSRPASYTNYGNSLVWVAAPGGDFAYPGNENCTVPRVPAGTVTNPCWVFDMVMSTVRGSTASISSYSWAAGTSMAAPHVAGVAALIKQAHPEYGAAQLKNAIAQSADGQGHDPYLGRGFLNAARAVTE